MAHTRHKTSNIHVLSSNLLTSCLTWPSVLFHLHDIFGKQPQHSLGCRTMRMCDYLLCIFCSKSSYTPNTKVFIKLLKDEFSSATSNDLQNKSARYTCSFKAESENCFPLFCNDFSTYNYTIIHQSCPFCATKYTGRCWPSTGCQQPNEISIVVCVPSLQCHLCSIHSVDLVNTHSLSSVKVYC